MKNTNTPRLLRLSEVCKITTLSKSSVYLYMSKGNFPKSVSLGERSVVWLEDEIRQWIDNRIKQRDQIAA